MLSSGIPSWLPYLAILPALWALVQLIEYVSRKISKTRHPLTGQSPTINAYNDFKIHGLKRIKRSSKLLSVSRAVLAADSLFILGLDAFVLYSWFQDKSTVKWNLTSVTLFVFLIAFPIFFLLDVFIFDQRIIKRGFSRVAEPGQINVEGDSKALFQKCQSVLIDMNAKFLNIDQATMLIEADLGKELFYVKIRHTRGLKHIVYLFSDSKWLTTRWDFGSNKRHVDTFMNKIVNNTLLC